MSAREAVIGGSSTLVSRRRPRWLVALMLLVAVAVSGAVSAALVLRLPRPLVVSTDIVGYPIFAAYNVDRLKSIYYIGVLFFPILALVIYLGLTWFVTRLRQDAPEGRDQVQAGESPAVDWPASGTLAVAAAWARVLAAGLACGLGASIAFSAVGAFWVTLAGVAAAYAVVVIADSALLRVNISRVNVLASPLVIVGLAAAAASSRVTVASDGSVHQYSWLPLWAAIAITAAVFGWVFLRSRRAVSEPAIRGLERQMLLFVACPVSVLLLMSRVPGALGGMDMFHDGEGLAAAQLTTAGYFPWRDLMSIHGIFQDVLTPLVGMQLFDNSRWGAEAGRAMILYPLAYAFLVIFVAWLFKRSWLLLLSFVALILGGKLLPIVGSRFMFLPLVLLLLAVVLERRKWWLGVALGCTLAIQTIFVPETAFAIVACGLIVILHDWFQRRPGARLIDTFSLTASCAAGGAATFVVFGLVLLSQHALGDFLFYFTLFAANRGLAGGVPLDIPHLGIRALDIHSLSLLYKDRSYIFFAFSTPAALLLAFLYYASKLIRKQPLDTADWVIGAVAIFSLLYYEKFLERADLGHAEQVYAEVVPLISFLVYRACTYVDGSLARWRSGPRSVSVLGWKPATVASLLIAVVLVPGSLAARLAATPAQFNPVVASLPQVARMGYAQNGVDLATYQDVGMVVNAYLRLGDWVYDFSNEPGLYYYLLGHNPHTRYYHISMAIPEAGQRDLISQLERDQPKLVVFTNDRYGLPLWDGIPTMVRHYDVSQYILDHYTPLLSTHTQILYGLTSANLSSGTAALLPLNEPILTDDLAFRGYPCDWGYIPNFLSISPPASPRAAAPVTLTTAAGKVGFANVKGWAVDMETGAPDSRLVVLANGEVVGEGTPTIDRPDVAQFTGKQGAVRSGFEITVSIPASVLVLSSGEPFIQVFGISAGGVASELGIGSGALNGKQTTISPPISALKLGGSADIPVRAGPSTGIIDWIDASRYQLELAPPPGASWSDYRWIEIATRSGFGEDQWSLSDVAGGGAGHEISFKTLDRSPASIRVHVGSCAQWHGYAPARLLLSYSSVQDVAAVRLIP